MSALTLWILQCLLEPNGLIGSSENKGHLPCLQVLLGMAFQAEVSESSLYPLTQGSEQWKEKNFSVLSKKDMVKVTGKKKKVTGEALPASEGRPVSDWHLLSTQHTATKVIITANTDKWPLCAGSCAGLAGGAVPRRSLNSHKNLKRRGFLPI